MDIADIRIIDAHIHQWDPFGNPREFSRTARLLRTLPLPLGLAVRLASRRDREFVGEPSAYLGPYLPADYRTDAGALPVESVVHIEVEWAGPKAEETRWVTALPFGVDTPALAAVSGGGSPADPGFTELLEAHLSASPLVRGIRSMVAQHPDTGIRSFADGPNALRSRAFLDGFAALVERDLAFEAWVYSHQIPEVTALAQRYPEATIVLNHLGTPAGIFGPVGKHTGRDAEARAGILERWRTDIADLAESPNVVAKVSGLMMPILGHPVPRAGTPTPVPELTDRIGPLLRHAADTFGADRLIWGSNFPVDRPITSITGSAEAVATVLAEHLGDSAPLEKVFRANAQRVYRLD
ncbi:amidohydrolase family protein [Nocardia flavorosea]|uniref:amidohydrolase family protein n=1 Tax=Nocardia flavorosea TaxID=53429 RepID=UPI00189505C3|nr:amidohydrolase family protein [Nocardia flavorosea]MBF6349205.1 amidohydrolase family protein [Nocardia flavorosea]